jgi:hypothetical protein
MTTNALVEGAKAKCCFCIEGNRPINIAESNENFVIARIEEENLDEAITISRIAWDNFPVLKESADTRKIVDTLLKGVQKMINEQILAPITTSTNGLTALMGTIERLTERNPALIEESSKRNIQSLQSELIHVKDIVSGLYNAPQIQQISQMLSQLLYKPNSKGHAGETVLADLWPQYFNKDLIEVLGGAGREDCLVIPYFNSGIADYGERISIERKTGKQQYSGAHLKGAVQHAIERGARYAIIVYDTQDNLPNKTIFTREKGVLIAVVDLQSATWKMAREIFEVLQKELSISRRDITEINIATIQEVANDVGTLLKLTADVRGNNAKIRSYSEKIDEGLDEIRSALKDYQHKLRSATGGVPRNDGVVHAVANASSVKEADIQS